MKQLHNNWLAKAPVQPRKVLTGSIRRGKKLYKRLQTRYGRRYSAAMAAVVFIGFFSPLPGTWLLALAGVVGVAEVHRAINRNHPYRGYPMSIKCDIILQWHATPEQLRTLGTALWRWCVGTAGNTGIYQYLDNQGLADLIAGKLPAQRQMAWPGQLPCVLVRVAGDPSRDRLATIDSLRRAISSEWVKDILIDGASWNQINQQSTQASVNHGTATGSTNANGTSKARESQTGTLSGV